ncbi:ATP-dependent DNA ligase [Numidum massiliense]|uniref:ATP-dependent DNA ligase n=1 Tax=Numidum massiliense TaxID=1522315 RepID=UPI0009E878D3|nr:RNA ligase family protein [Numidum massiliense]
MQPLAPMEPKRGEIIPSGSDWIAQIKWDGVRLLTYYDGARLQLFNRKKRERTQHYPELTDIRNYCRAKSVILDGEVIALGPDGKPSFHEVMRRDGIRRLERVPRMRQLVPVTFMIFDLLYADGSSLCRLPLHKRLELLETLVTPNECVQLVSSYADGVSLFNVMKENDMEGIVMKQRESPYVAGTKSDRWLKIKNYHDLIAVIGGFTVRDQVVNALLLGLYDADGRLWYIGHAGTGKLSQAEWRTLTALLHPTVTTEQPFANRPERHRDAYWVRPTVAVKVTYIEWTPGGALRQPSVQSVVDVPLRQCVFPGRDSPFNGYMT